MPITIAICDDEKNIREEIMRLVKNQCEDCCVDLYDLGYALLSANKEYDIYLLDIQMDGINGMETAEQIRKRHEAQSGNNSVIIFVTALKEYMEAAFDVNAFHYLVKPIDENKFKTVFARAVSDCRKMKENAENHILVKSRDTYHKVLQAKILYIESHDKKVIINSVDGVIEYYGKMQDIDKTLGDIFFRCHRCYIVNMEHIIRYNSNTIWMKNGSEILLAQKKYPQFVEAYMKYAMNGGLIRGNNT